MRILGSDKFVNKESVSIVILIKFARRYKKYDMKIYHKFLLYQNKLLKPYIRIILGLVEALTYLASLTLIVGVIYEHGFPLSVDEIAKIQVLYKAVWIIFLIDVTLHISLEYRSTKKQYRKLAWILSGLLYLTLIPVIFIVRRRKELSCSSGSSWMANFTI